MDQPELDQGLHEQALRGLGQINFLSRSAGILWPAVRRLAAQTGGRPLRLLDVASGGGDVTLALERKARAAGLSLQIDGCDKSPVAIAFAKRNAESRASQARFFELDVLGDSLPSGYDVVACSLFLHHLEQDEAVHLLRSMAAAAGKMVLVNDLVRSRTGYLLAQVAGRVITRSPIVHIDGPLSVAGAFTPAEALELARQAGLEGATCARHWPQRFLLSWSRA